MFHLMLKLRIASSIPQVVIHLDTKSQDETVFGRG